MKKLLVLLGAMLTAISISTASYAGSVGVGVTANWSDLQTDGSQTLKDTSAVTSTSVSEEVLVPELFMEIIADNGFAVGVSFIPTQELGSKSRTDTDLATATNKASAEIDNLIMLYADIPVYAGTYLTGGITYTTLITTEDLGTGSSYDDQSITGVKVGVGYKGDISGGAYYKAEVSYTDFDSYSGSSDTGNTVNADMEATSAHSIAII